MPPTPPGVGGTSSFPVGPDKETLVTHPTHRRALGALGLAALLILTTACSGGGDKDAASSGGDVALDMFAEAMGHADPQVSADLARRSFGRDQEALEDCMEEQGFEYEPMSAENLLLDPRSELSADQYARQFGFGISTASEMFQSGGATPPSDRDADPNSEMLANLTPSEQEAWTTAVGECESRIAEAGVTDSPRADLTDVAERLQQEVATDPEVEEALATWRDCMAEEGFDYDDPRQMREELYQRYEGLGGGLGPDGAVQSSEVSGSPDGSGSITVGGASGPAADEFREEEIATAVAHVVCEPPFMDVYRRVARQAERSYLEEHPELGDGLASL